MASTKNPFSSNSNIVTAATVGGVIALGGYVLLTKILAIPTKKRQKKIIQRELEAFNYPTEADIMNAEMEPDYY